MPRDQEERDEERRRAALRDLDRAERESEVLLSGAVKRAAERARDHFAAAEAQGRDPIEIWGRRIGRALSLVAFVALVLYLFAIYS